MKKYLILLFVTTITIGSFAQTINKIIPYKDGSDEDHYSYVGSFPVLDKKILTIFTYPDNIMLQLLDENFIEISNKKITRKSTGIYTAHYFLTKNYLFIEEEVEKKKIIVTKISLTDNLSSEKFDHNPGYRTDLFLGEFDEEYGRYPELHIGIDEKNYYHIVSEKDVYFKKVNFSSNSIVDYKINLLADERVKISKFQTFENTENIAICRSKLIKKNSSDQVALHDVSGKELSSFDRLENNIYKSNVFFANNKDNVYALGNYKEMPKKIEITIYENRYRKPDFTGVYLKSLSAKNPIEKYYKYSEFKNFNKQLLADKMSNKIDRLRFKLEDMVFVGNEKIIFSTIEQDSYDRSEGGKRWDGKAINYILIFAVNDAGEILWDQVISLDSHDRPRLDQPAFCGLSNFPKTLNVEMVDDKITCHYSFREKINSFEIDKGQISNNKETLYEKKPYHYYKIEYQFKSSIYWYDNFYFNYTKAGSKEGYIVDKTQFDK